MQLTSFVVAAVLSLALPLFVAAESHGPSRRHASLAQRKRGDLEKRNFDGQATYYAVGLGACGKWNGPSDFIVALNTPQFGGGYPGPNCFKSITISARGKTANAVIMDECPGCGWGSLDLSEGLFQHFASLDDGVFPISWWFNDGSSSGGGAPPPPPPPPPPKKPTYKPTPTWVAPTTTSKWVDPSPWTTEKTSTKTKTTPSSTWSEPETTSSSTSTKKSSTSKSLYSTSTSASSTSTSLAAPPAYTEPAAANNIKSANQLILGLAAFVKH